MGFIILIAMAVYLLLSLGVVAGAIMYAKKNGKSIMKWGWGAALVIFLIPFWDWIPTVASQQLYCARDSGFWVYKTLDQWKAENPGVMETLVVNKGEPSSRQGDMENYADTYSVNQRFNLVVKHTGKFLFNRWRHEREVVDSKTDTVLARYVDFSTSQEQQQAGWSGWKFWLANRYCIGGRDQLINFGKFYLQFKGAEK